GVSDRTAADALRGVRLLARLADLPALQPDEYYHHEVLGFTVETTDGAVIGTIAAIMANVLHAVCERRAGAREHLIPVVADLVRAADRARRRVPIAPLPGLLDCRCPRPSSPSYPSCSAARWPSGRSSALASWACWRCRCISSATMRRAATSRWTTCRTAAGRAW